MLHPECSTPSVQVMGPGDFQKAYTEYYCQSNNDSPEKSRKSLCDRIITVIEHKLTDGQAKVKVLDVGAGRQILEAELQRNPRFRKVSDRVQLVTLDIALLKSNPDSPLLATNISHVTADGCNIPFATGSFDIVCSSMAIDFMPRLPVFSEVKRVIKPDGALLINFHHPDLMHKKDQEKQNFRDQIKQQNRALLKLEKFGRQSHKYGDRLSKLLLKIEALECEIDHIDDFFVHHFPQLIFLTVEEIETFLKKEFPNARQKNQERTGMGTNGWFETNLQLGAGNNSVQKTLQNELQIHSVSPSIEPELASSFQ